MSSVLQKIINRIFGPPEKNSRLMYEGRVEKIIRITSEVTGVPEIELLSKRRGFSDQRHIAMYLSIKLLGMSYPEVGRLFSRDHTTVLRACKKVEKRGRGRTKVNIWLKEIEKRLSA